jgi:hypothetical protein
METLNETLLLYGLPSLSEYQYNILRGTFEPPEGFRFNSKKHKETAAFMRDEKIYSLWSPNKNTKRVFAEMLDGHNLLKTDLHILLMGRLPDKVIVDRINIKYRIANPFNEAMIAAYRHFFWNVGVATPEEWERVLAGHASRDALMASLYCGEQQALYRAGFNPRVDGRAMLKEIMRQGYFRLQSLRFHEDTKYAIDTYAKLSARLLSVYEVLYAEGAGLQDQLQEFRAILMRHEDPAVKMVDDLIDKVAGGGYTGDGEEETTHGGNGVAGDSIQ